MKKHLHGKFIRHLQNVFAILRLARKALTPIYSGTRLWLERWPRAGNFFSKHIKMRKNETWVKPWLFEQSSGRRWKQEDGEEDPGSSVAEKHQGNCFLEVQSFVRGCRIFSFLMSSGQEIVPAARVVNPGFKMPAMSSIISIRGFFGGFVGGLNELNRFFGIIFRRKCFRGGKEHLGLYRLTV